MDLILDSIHFTIKRVSYFLSEQNSLISKIKNESQKVMSSFYLKEHFFEIGLWLRPRCNSVTEKDKVLNNPAGVHIDHVTHTTESRIFLFVITYVTQRCTPDKIKVSWCRVLATQVIKQNTNINEYPKNKLTKTFTIA